VFAELAAQFLNLDDLKGFIFETGFELRVSDEKTLGKAGLAWQEYAKRKNKKGLACHACGESLSVICPRCKQAIQAKQHLISDFIVGAHASVFAQRLITRDRGFYRAYFKGLEIVDPSEAEDTRNPAQGI
jgi:hypothetical protein